MEARLAARALRPDRELRRRRRRPAPQGLERAAVFAIAAGLPIYLAVNGGGYDIVTRQEVSLVIWWAIAVAFLFGILPRAHLPPGAGPALAALGGVCAWTALSLIWTESYERTVADLTRVVGYGGVLVLAWSALDRATWKAAAAGVSVAALSITALALTSRLLPEAFPLTEVELLFEGDRLSYPLDYWNAVAAWSSMTVGIGLAWSVQGRLPLVRSVSLAAVPVAGLAVYLTYSRAGVIAACAGVLAVVALSRSRWTALAHALAAAAGTALAVLVARTQTAIAEGGGGEGAWVVVLGLGAACLACAWVARTTSRSGTDRLGRRESMSVLRRRTRLIGTLVPAAITFALLIALIVAPGVVSSAERSGGGYGVDEGDPAARLVSLGSDRGEVWSSALGAFSSQPALGIGSGAFEFWWARDGEESYFLRDAHSLYLETLAELGLVGLLLLIAFLAAMLTLALRACRRARRSSDVAATVALTAAFIVFLLHAGVDWMWESTAVTVLALGGAAIVAASGSARRVRSRRLSAPRAGIAALAVLAGAVQIPAIVSTERLRDAADAAVAGATDNADRYADDAVAAQPWAATPYAQRALIARSEQRLEEARLDVLRAISREPTNWRHQVLLAQVEAQSGRLAESLQALDEARRLHPSAAAQFEPYRQVLSEGLSEASDEAPVPP